MKMVDKSSKLDKYATNMSGSGGGVGSGGGASNAGSGSTANNAAGGASHVHHQNGKPVPMKLFAAWEVDRTPPNCIPR